MENVEKRYSFTLPREVKDGLLKFDEVVFDGQKYFNNYLKINESVVSESEMMEFLRMGFPEECFEEHLDPMENFKKKMKRYSDNILNIQEKYKNIIVKVFGNNREFYLLFDKKDKVFYKYTELNPVRTGIGTGNKEGYLYNFLTSLYSPMGENVDINIFIQPKENMKLVFTKKYKYYITSKKCVCNTTGSGAGQITGWIDKLSKDTKSVNKKYKKIDNIKCIIPEVIKKLTMEKHPDNHLVKSED
jgi:hypothetical protein